MKIKTKEGKILEVHWQQYSVGLYVCFYETIQGGRRLYDQFGLDCSKEEFIENLKKDFEVLDEVTTF